MKIQVAIAAAASALMLAACGSGGSSAGISSPPVAQTTSSTSAAVLSSSVPVGANPYCATIADFPTKLSGFQSELAAPDAAKLKEELSAAAAYFDGLKVGAPAEVATAVGTITDALKQLELALTGSNPNMSTLSSLVPKLTPAITTLSSWVGTNCAGA